MVLRRRCAGGAQLRLQLVRRCCCAGGAQVVRRWCAGGAQLVRTSKVTRTCASTHDAQMAACLQLALTHLRREG